MNFVIPQQLLIAVIQTIQGATHPNMPYGTVSQILQALTQLQAVEEPEQDEQEQDSPE